MAIVAILGGGGGGGGNPRQSDFTMVFDAARPLLYQPVDARGTQIGSPLVAAPAANTLFVLSDLFTLPNGAVGGYLTHEAGLWWNTSAGSEVPTTNFRYPGVIAIGSAMGSPLAPASSFRIEDLNPYVWADFGDAATMFTSEHATTLAGVTPVANANDPIRVMYDKGSFGLIWRQGTLANRPLYDPALFGGSGGALFDGTNDVLKDAILDKTLPKDHCFLAVLNCTDFADDRVLGGSSAFGSNTFGYSLSATNGRPSWLFRSVSGYTLAAGSEITAAEDTVLAMRLSGDPTTNARGNALTHAADLGVVTGVGTAAAGVITDHCLGGDDNGEFWKGALKHLIWFPACNRHLLQTAIAHLANEASI